MTKFIKILIFVIAMQTMFAPSAFAISKLSSVMRRVKSYMVVAQDYANAAQEQVNGVVSEANTYIRMAKSGELASMAEQYAPGKVKDIAQDYAEKYGEKYKAKAEKYAKDKLDKYKAKVKQKKLEKAKKKLAAKQAEKDDYKESVKDAKIQKNIKIDEELNQLKLKIQSAGLSEEEHEKLAEEIAVLEAQKHENMDQPLEQDETYKGIEKDEKNLTKEVDELQEETAEAEIQEGLAAQAEELFDQQSVADEENESIYKTEIDALFLKEDEDSTSENLARIKKNRNREYYNALQKAMEISTIGTAASADMEEEVGNYVKMAAELDGNYALKNSTIALIISNAKIAARFTEALLAEIRLKTTKDMVSWNNKNRLYDYKKAVTEFDFDSYALKKSDLKDKAKKFYEDRKDKINDFYDKNKDNIKDMWHKI